FATIDPALRTVGTASSTGFLDYNGLLVKFTRRFANGFSVFNSYTYGKTIDLESNNDGTVTLTNIFNPNYSRGPAEYDVTHTFSSNWIYALPFARDRMYGGWQVSGILYLRSGLPFTVIQSGTMLSTGISGSPYGPRPNRIADGSLSNPTIDKWFDTS